MQPTLRRLATLLLSALVLAPATGSPQTTGAAPSLPLGAGRPETEGITRTTLKDDAKSTVTRVRFAPGATEPPHTHPFDVILVPVVTSSTVDIGVGTTTLTSIKPGDVQFVAKDVTHHVGNRGKEPFELIAIALK